MRIVSIGINAIRVAAKATLLASLRLIHTPAIGHATSGLAIDSSSIATLVLVLETENLAKLGQSLYLCGLTLVRGLHLALEQLEVWVH